MKSKGESSCRTALEAAHFARAANVNPSVGILGFFAIAAMELAIIVDKSPAALTTHIARQSCGGMT